MNPDFMRGVRWERDQILLLINSMDISKLDENTFSGLRAMLAFGKWKKLNVVKNRNIQ